MILFLSPVVGVRADCGCVCLTGEWLDEKHVKETDTWKDKVTEKLRKKEGGAGQH